MTDKSAPILSYNLGLPNGQSKTITFQSPTHFDLESKTSEIGDCYLSGVNFRHIKSISTDGLKNVAIIGTFFLNGCENLERIDLSGLSNVKKIGKWFMGGCTSLKEINLNPISHLNQLEEAFGNCPKLETLFLNEDTPLYQYLVNEYFSDDKIGSRLHH